MRWLSPIALVVGCNISTVTFAQTSPTFPNRAIRMIVPFAAGGAVDLMARPIGKKLHEILGQPAVIDNRAGAGGSIAAEFVAKSPPDGYTLFVGSTSPLAINPAYFDKVGYDTVRDFTPISLIAQQPLVIVAHPSLPVRNPKDLIALAKKNPGKMSYGSAGPGTSNHLVGALLGKVAGIDIVHVPYKGGGPALTALLSGEIELQVSQPNTMVPHVRNGRVRAVATTGKRRSETMPDVSTLAEAGFKELEIVGWYCIVGPAGMARANVERLENAIQRAVASPEFSNLMKAEGTEPISSTPDELGNLMKSEVRRWMRIVQIAGVKPGRN